MLYFLYFFSEIFKITILFLCFMLKEIILLKNFPCMTNWKITILNMYCKDINLIQRNLN